MASNLHKIISDGIFTMNWVHYNYPMASFRPLKGLDLMVNQSRDTNEIVIIITPNNFSV